MLPQNVTPITLDVVGLYQNIPHQEGLDSLRKALDTRSDKSVPTQLLIDFMTHVLKQNVFEFNGKLYIQIVGTAMGTESAVTYACIYMGGFDEIIKEYATDKDGSSFIHVILRFIDD